MEEEESRKEEMKPEFIKLEGFLRLQKLEYLLCMGEKDEDGISIKPENQRLVIYPRWIFNIPCSWP